MVLIKELPREEYFSYGHRACAGCAEPIATRIVTKAIGRDIIVVSPTGCLEVISSPYPQTAWRVPWIHVAFENAAAVASGIEAALKAQIRKGRREGRKIHIVSIAGDGGTADIGLQALSGAMERGHDMLYVCIDNEAYMNTGIQRSSATPYGAWTTTTPYGKLSIGEDRWKKDVPAIIAAHDVSYVATASVSYPTDLYEKAKKGAEIEGPAYIHVLTPCPVGWRFDSSLTIRMGRLAVETGYWPLYEVVNGEFKLTKRIRKRKPIKEYLELQGRFRHLPDKEIQKIQEHIDAKCKSMGME
ncbi:MAG: Pyruvate synthase subunit PorB [Candidatus Bathyarchaeota archaeon BA1]|nr:MAG: Pyruvate synthase subunit PorB [Candidatus Bathyarchaeota archaeon BA1]